MKMVTVAATPVATLVANASAEVPSPEANSPMRS